MIKRNKTIAKIMVVALCSNAIPCINAFASENVKDSANITVAVQENNNVTTGAAVEIKNNESNENEIKNKIANDFEFNAATGTITKYTGEDPEVVIPSEINGVKVTAIGKYAFTENGNNMESLTIPDSVTSIEDYAFWYCRKLQNVEFSKCLTSIGKGAFGGCSSLKSITLPDSLTRIPEISFAYCDNLKEVNLPSSLTCIDSNAFLQDWSLYEITLPNTLTKISIDSFENKVKFNVSSESVKELLMKHYINENRINLVSDEN